MQSDRHQRNDYIDNGGVPISLPTKVTQIEIRLLLLVIQYYYYKGLSNKDSEVTKTAVE